LQFTNNILESEDVFNIFGDAFVKIDSVFIETDIVFKANDDVF